MSGIDLSTLNDAQRQIATTLDDPLFVEAGAGSGKTFTLTRRVVWALSPGSGADGQPFLDDLSQVLVITFTNAAAREIKERVRQTLRDAGMHEQALAVDAAWISTIHGMCQRILRRYALELGLDPSFGVCGTHQQKELLDVAVERAVGAARKEARPGSAVARAFEAFEYPGVVSRVLSLVTVAHASVDGFGSVSIPKVGGNAGVTAAMQDLTRAFEALDAAKLSAAARGVVDASLEQLRAFGELPPGSRTAERAATALEGCKPPRFSKTIAELHADVKAELAHAKALVALERAGEHAPTLLELARHTDECYMTLKRERGLLDHDDLITLALKAVVDDPHIAACYAGRFRLVMVDEFQDTDAKQLKLIATLAGGPVKRQPLSSPACGDVADDAQHLATVGDAQQSIYRFRGADVGVFNARGTRVPQEGHVRLDMNYRSHADVLAFVDKVCGGGAGVLDDFMHLDACPTRKDGYMARELPRVAVEVTSGSGAGGNAQARTEQLAEQVADRLARYRDAGEPAGGMALLLGSTTRAQTYIDALRSRGLECVVTGGSTFTKAPEVGTMLALLRTLANPRDTQSGLFPLLSSEMFELDANDFLQLGSRRQDKLDAPTKRTIDRGIFSLELFGNAEPSRRLRHAHEVLVHAFAQLGTRPVADVCMSVVRDSGWLSRLEGQGAQGVAREANVLATVRYIRDLTDELGLGPARAAAEFARWMEVSKLPPASLAGAEHDTVRIMTIHASKGLEYPVVAVAECWNKPRQEGGLWSAADGDGGVEVVIAPRDCPSLDGADEASRAGDLVAIACELRNNNKAADAQEKARLLYVALTRAREALVLALNVPVTKKGISSDLASGVVGALFDGALPPEGTSEVDYGGSAPASVRHVGLYGPARTPKETEAEQADGSNAAGGHGRVVALYPPEDVQCDEVRLTRAREGVFSYSSSLAEAAHAVVHVSGPAHEGGHVAEAVPAARKEQPARSAPRPPLPRKGELAAEAQGKSVASDEDKATNLGSAFHMIAQTMVETGSGPDPERVEALSRRWHLSERQRARLDAALDRWCTSDLRTETLAWNLVRAEVPFFALSGDSPHGRYVEGAIDLLCTEGYAYEGPALVVDYKTGDVGLTEEQVHARHAPQAELYASVLLSLGFTHVTCAFMAVETGVVARYEF